MGDEKDLERRTLKELRELARKAGIPGRSRMRKAELVRALKEHFARARGEAERGTPGRKRAPRATPSGRGRGRAGTTTPPAGGRTPPVSPAKGRSGEKKGRSRKKTEAGGVRPKERGATPAAPKPPAPARKTAPEPAPESPAPRAGRRASRTKAFSEVRVPEFILMAVDPVTAHATWEIPEEALEAARRRFEGATPELVLRLEVFGTTPAAKAASETPEQVLDISLAAPAGRRFLQLPKPAALLGAEIGLRHGETFRAVCRSNRVDLPRAGEAAPGTFRLTRVAGEADPRLRPRPPVPEVPPAPGEVHPLLVAEAAVVVAAETEEKPAAAQGRAGEVKHERSVHAPPPVFIEPPPAASAVTEVGGPEGVSAVPPGEAEAPPVAAAAEAAQPAAGPAAGPETARAASPAPETRAPAQATQAPPGEPRPPEPPSPEPVVSAALRLLKGRPAVEEAIASREEEVWEAPGERAAEGPYAPPLPSSPEFAVKEGEIVAQWGVSSAERIVSGGGFEQLAVELYADLVVYGRAPAGTRLRIGGVETVAGPDGRFEVRFALPGCSPRVPLPSETPAESDGEGGAVGREDDL